MITFKDLTLYTEFIMFGQQHFLKIRDIYSSVERDKPVNCVNLDNNHLCYIEPRSKVSPVVRRRDCDDVRDRVLSRISDAIRCGEWVLVRSKDVSKGTVVYASDGQVYEKSFDSQLTGIFDETEREAPNRVFISRIVAAKESIPYEWNSDGIYHESSSLWDTASSMSAFEAAMSAFKATMSYREADVLATIDHYNTLKEATKLKIENVIFNKPATIVFWKDGTKTVVKAQPGEKYDAEKGLALAIAKKALGNEGNYYDTLKEWLPKTSNEAKKKQRRKQ